LRTIQDGVPFAEPIEGSMRIDGWRRQIRQAHSDGSGSATKHRIMGMTEMNFMDFFSVDLASDVFWLS